MHGPVFNDAVGIINHKCSNKNLTKNLIFWSVLMSAHYKNTSYGSYKSSSSAYSKYARYEIMVYVETKL